MPHKLFFFVLLFISVSAKLLAIEVGEKFPDVKIAGYQTNKELSKNSLQNKVSIINFWATWCEACKVELKEMQTVFVDLLKSQDVQIAYVTLDKDPRQAEAWVKAELANQKEFLERMYQDPEFKASQTLNVDAFPMTLIIGKDGQIKFIQRGFKEGEGSTAKLLKFAQELVQQK